MDSHTCLDSRGKHEINTEEVKTIWGGGSNHNLHSQSLKAEFMKRTDNKYGEQMTEELQI